MRCQVEKNKEILRDKIEQLCEKPVTYESAEHLILCHKALKIMCELYGHQEHETVHDEACKADLSITKLQLPHFGRKMAMEWTANMENEDGTTGPHWSMERIQEEMEQHGVKCDPVKFWAVINAIYSDDVAVAKKHGVNTMEYYIDRAKAWLEDKDAVPDKAGAYYMYITKH